MELQVWGRPNHGYSHWYPMDDNYLPEYLLAGPRKIWLEAGWKTNTSGIPEVVGSLVIAKGWGIPYRMVPCHKVMSNDRQLEH